MKKILFVVNGTGLGNSTRAASIIEQLAGPDLQVTVATSRQGLNFFKNRVQITDLFALKSSRYFAGTRWRHGGLCFSAALFAWAGVVNAWRLFWIIRKIRPSAIVYDSVYNLLPLLLTRIPVISVNNADRVVDLYFQQRQVPWSARLHFWTVEFPDYLFQWLLPDFVLSPRLQKSQGPRHRKKFLPIGMPVRAGFSSVTLSPTPIPARTQPAVFLLTTSGAAVPRLEIAPSIPSRFKVLRQQLMNPIEETGSIPTLLDDDGDLFREADIIAGPVGFSTLSQALALKRPLLLFPVPGHAEQHLNAQEIEKLGLGICGDRQDPASSVKQILKKYPELQKNFSRTLLDVNGALEAANLIRACMI